MAEFNPTLIRSRWRAYDPSGKFKEIVTLTADAKRRYEAKGWTFERPQNVQVFKAEREN